MLSAEREPTLERVREAVLCLERGKILRRKWKVRHDLWRARLEEILVDPEEAADRIATESVAPTSALTAI